MSKKIIKKESCIKTNLILFGIYLMLGIGIALINYFLIPMSEVPDGWAELVLFARGIVFAGIGVMVYSIFLPLFIKMKEGYWRNFKNYLSVIITNCLIFIFTVIVFNNLRLGITFLLISTGGMLLTSYIKYGIFIANKSKSQ